MPNGDTGRGGWLLRKNHESQVLWKMLGLVFIPAIGWLAITVIGHSEELSAHEVDVSRTTEAAEQAIEERHAIDLKLSRLEERQMQQQRSNDAAHTRQDAKLDRILDRLER